MAGQNTNPSIAALRKLAASLDTPLRGQHAHPAPAYDARAPAYREHSTPAEPNLDDTPHVDPATADYTLHDDTYHDHAHDDALTPPLSRSDCRTRLLHRSFWLRRPMVGRRLRKLAFAGAVVGSVALVAC